jgi:hypothetical protein
VVADSGWRFSSRKYFGMSIVERRLAIVKGRVKICEHNQVFVQGGSWVVGVMRGARLSQVSGMNNERRNRW